MFCTKRTSSKTTPPALPSGIVAKHRHSAFETSSLYVEGVGTITGRKHRNTFSVRPKHEILADPPGVKFNVETVPGPLKEDLEKNRFGRHQIVHRIKEDSAAFYGDKNGYKLTKPDDIRLEAMADAPDNLIHAGGTGFFTACLIAFAQHLPLALSPDHVWVLISYAFAKHVDGNAEKLREKFVQHEGKKRLEVQADHMVMSGGGGDGLSGSSPQQWEDTIFPDFSRQIKNHIGEKIHGAIASDFSTTTSAARAAHEITLMSAMKNYFSYGFRTCCGIPSITLLGSKEDWESLRSHAEDIGGLMTTEFSSMWMPLLLPVLDQFVDSYNGNVDHGFWQSMVKMRHTGGGSGAHSFISGWIQILFPYLRSGRVNTGLKPWQDMYFSGPEPEDFPSIISSAPVDWNYYGNDHNLHFHAGITGCSQDSIGGTISPVVCWYVTHDPPQEPDSRLEMVKTEMKDIIKAHAYEAQSEPLDKDAPWYRRFCLLHLEQQSIERPALCAPLKRKIDEMDKNWPEYNSTEYNDFRKRYFNTKMKLKEASSSQKEGTAVPADDAIKSLLKEIK